MKLSRFNPPNKEKTTVKRMLLVVAAALMLLNALAIPTVARADGGGSGSQEQCANNSVCKP
jgi:hypothetical protein